MSTAVNIGMDGSLAGITQTPLISNSVSGTVLSIDDGSDTTDSTVSLGDESGAQGVSGLGPSPIRYYGGSLRSLAITTDPGSSAGTTTVNVSQFGAPTTLSLGSIHSNLTLQTVNYPATIDDLGPLGSSITAAFGDGTSYNMLSPLTVNGYKLTNLTVDDTGFDPNVPGLPTVLDPLTTVTINSGAITRVGNAPWVPAETVDYSNLDSLNLDPGQTYPTEVKAIATSAAYTIINAGAATSLVDLGSGLTANLGGLPAVHGPSNKATAVVVDDMLDTTARQVTIQPARGFGPNAVIGLNPGAIYLDNNLKSLTLDPGPQTVITDEDSPGFPISINPDAGMLFPVDTGDLVPEAVDAILAEGSGTVGEDPPKVKLILDGGAL